MIRVARWIAGLLLAFIGAVVVGAVPVPVSGLAAQTANPARSVRIFVLSNGFHSDVAVPAHGGDTLRALNIDPADYPVDVEQVRYWAFGWGSRTAYTSLLDLADLTPGIIVRALSFDRSVMHVQPLGELTIGPGSYAFDIAPAELDRLLLAIRISFGDEVRLIPDVTQGFGDRFYEAAGRFSMFRGCNVWTGERLREVGIGVGLWPLFAQSLEFGLARTASRPAALNL